MYAFYEHPSVFLGCICFKMTVKVVYLSSQLIHNYQEPKT
uniref:Uncharacterized protein n=1 Tax=Anguilla anguilla TaxID=7936 RepID=A0A0E9RWH2_ANGAN